MKNKHYLFSIVLLFFLFFTYYKYTKKTEINIIDTSSKVNTTSKEITGIFVKNEEKGNLLFKDKVIQVTGKIKEVNTLNNRSTIFLQSNTKHNVICEMQLVDKIHETKSLISKTATIKGICKGFLNDVIILNCSITNIEN